LETLNIRLPKNNKSWTHNSNSSVLCSLILVTAAKITV